METSVELAILQSMVTGSGSTRLTHLPTGTMVPSVSSMEMVVATSRISYFPYPAEAWVSTYSRTPEGTIQSGTMSSLLSESTSTEPAGNVQQVSPVLTPKTTEIDLSTWFCSTEGTTIDTHVLLSTSSTGLQGTAISLVSILKGTTRSVIDKSELRTVTSASTTVIYSTALSKRTVTTKQQTRGPQVKAYIWKGPDTECLFCGHRHNYYHP